MGTEADATFPLVSVAVAITVCAPFEAEFVFHITVNGAEVSVAPITPPSTLNTTVATPTLSVAFTLSVTMPPTFELGNGDIKVTTGGILSVILVALFTLTVTGADVEVFPAVSRARAVRT
jgi:hypothetical protein